MKLVPALSTPLTPTLAVALLLAAAQTASAHPAPYAHKHVQAPSAEVVVIQEAPRKRVVKKVIYRPAPPTTVIISEPAPQVETVVVTAAPPPVVVHAPAPTVVRRSRVVVSPRTFPRDSESISIGLRGTGLALEGTKLGVSTDENMVMGGAGVVLRGRFGKHFGAELSADIVGGSNESVAQMSVPVMAALTYHFLPHSRFQPYIAGGGGVHFTQLDYLGGTYRHELIEGAAQLGVGVELFITDDISLVGDVRGTAVFKSIDSQAQVRQDCLSQIGGMSGFCDGLNTVNPNDKVDIGAAFHLGANIHF